MPPLCHKAQKNEIRCFYKILTGCVVAVPIFCSFTFVKLNFVSVAQHAPVQQHLPLVLLDKSENEYLVCRICRSEAMSALPVMVAVMLLACETHMHVHLIM